MVRVIRDKKGKTQFVEVKMKGMNHYFTPAEIRRSESQTRRNKALFKDPTRSTTKKRKKK